MRTIKFRGKGKINGLWYTGYLTKTRMMGVTIKDPITEVCVPIISETVGECLGRWDKHYNEIYEGDFVKDQNGSIWEVKFNEEHPYWIPFVFPCNDAPENFEIIGNKWDNPELAKEV